MATTFMALGTNGWIPSERRETCCSAILMEDKLLVFDCGSGARRLGHPELAPVAGNAKEIFIFLSHYHLDHIGGIIYLPALLKGKKVTIAGPGKPLSGITTAEALGRLTSFPFFALPIEEFPMDISVIDLAQGTNSFPGFQLTVQPQAHTDPSIGMRLNDLFAYATDTPCSDSTAELARGAAMLLHECWLDEDGCQAAVEAGNTRALNEHSGVSGVAGVAAAAEVELLALCHLNPGYREGRLRRMEQFARSLFENTLLLHDFQQFNLEE